MRTAFWLPAFLLFAQAPRYGPPSRIAVLEDPRINESSGIAASRRNPGLFWTHNDSDGGPFLYLFDRGGKSHGTWRVTGARNIDWEDIATGPGPVRGKPCLYIGDIGDNDRRRAEVIVYRVEEPAAVATEAPSRTHETAASAAFRFRYPDGPHDAEALLVHPQTGDVYIVSKARGADTVTGVYKAAAPLRPDSVLKRITTLHFPEESDITLLLGRVTAGDISPDGRRLALCDYFHGYEAVLPGSAAFDAIWNMPLSVIDLGQRRQGEGICYRLDGAALLATSEGRPSPLIEVVRRNP